MTVQNIFDEEMRTVKQTFPDGSSMSYAYNEKGQLLTFIHKDTEGILDAYSYEYDILGNKTGIEKQRRGLTEESGSYVYGYDALGRLSSVTKDGTALRSYSYDAFGNRTGLTENGKQTRYTYNALNQLLSKADVQGEETYSYDKRGNLTQILREGNITNLYVYGAINRLEEAVNAKGETAQYHYNGLGYRVGKEVREVNIPGIPTEPNIALNEQNLNPEKHIRYTIDFTRQYHNLLQKEENGQNQTYLWDGNVAGVYHTEGNTALNQQYYLQDELGSPIRLVDEEGILRESYGYDEFGSDLYGNQGQLQPFGYTGYQNDSVAGTYFAQAREYATEVGRFVNEDPIKGILANPQTQNRYKYCMNNAFKYIDPTGCCEELENVENLGAVEQVINDNIYGLTLDGLNITFASLGTYLKKGIVEATKPSNIGIGTWNNLKKFQLDDIAKVFGASADDVTKGFARVEVPGLLPKVTEELGYLGVAIDTISGIGENLEKGSSWQKTTSDAFVDATMSLSTMLAAGIASAEIGAWAGTIVPGAGNIIGAVGGFAVGIAMYVITDGIEIKGKSVREHVKDSFCNTFGWE